MTRVGVPPTRPQARLPVAIPSVRSISSAVPAINDQIFLGTCRRTDKYRRRHSQNRARPSQGVCASHGAACICPILDVTSDHHGPKLVRAPVHASEAFSSHRSALVTTGGWTVRPNAAQ